MPGIIQDPRQNDAAVPKPKAKRYGVIQINGEFVAYDKNDNKEELPYLPAGWRINKTNIKLEDMPPGKVFPWHDMTISKKVKSAADFHQTPQGVVNENLKKYMKGEGFDKKNGFAGSDPNYDE